MSFTTALYEGPSVTRFAPSVRPAARGKILGQGANTQCVAQPLRRLGQRRTRRGAIEVLIGAIGHALRSLGVWIEEQSTQVQYRRLENYLAQSSSHADLERRMREIERNDRLNWIDCGRR